MSLQNSDRNVKADSKTNPSEPPSPGNSVFVIGGLLLLVAVIALTVFLLNKPAPAATVANATNTVTGNIVTTAAVSVPTVANTVAPTLASGDIPIAADPSAQVQTFDNQGQYHLNPGETIQSVLHVPYNSDPPTSGPHLPNWSRWGVFQQPIQTEMQIHNLEHGGVVIQYDCPQGCTGAINALAPYALKYPAQNFTGVLLAPRPNLPNGARIAVSAWQHLLLLKTVDNAKIQNFIATYIGKGPEVDSSFKP